MKMTKKNRDVVAKAPVEADVPRSTINVVNNRNKKLRAFYRTYILPGHIAKTAGKVKAAMKEELAGHIDSIERYDLKEEYGAFKQARADRQFAYDNWRALATEAVHAKADEMLEALLKASTAEQDFRDQSEAYKSQYQ
jgi:hypothetical protein